VRICGNALFVSCWLSKQRIKKKTVLKTMLSERTSGKTMFATVVSQKIHLLVFENQRILKSNDLATILLQNLLHHECGRR
jgi:hypothetical protein